MMMMTAVIMLASTLKLQLAFDLPTIYSYGIMKGQCCCCMVCVLSSLCYLSDVFCIVVKPCKIGLCNAKKSNRNVSLHFDQYSFSNPHMHTLTPQIGVPN